MKIERLQIKNFRVFKDVELPGLSELAVFVGANGTGKSTLFDVFAFLREALNGDVHAALSRRGGFHEVRSLEQQGPISFELDFGEGQDGPCYEYRLEVADGVVAREELAMPSAGRAMLSRLLESSAHRVDRPIEAALDALDPTTHPLLCFDNSIRSVYPTLFARIVRALRKYGERGGQVIIGTHSAELVDATELREVYWLEKRGGFSTIHRASDDELLRSLVLEGDRPGDLWRQGLFGGVDP